MRKIEWTTAFKRDYKREMRGPFGKTLKIELDPILSALAADQVLLTLHRDHALASNWKGHRDCHIKPDLILLYRKPDDSRLELVRLGSHSELGL
jgi:mRNA interferase YafQ